MKMKLSASIAVLAVCMSFGIVRGDTIHVPENYPTIQEGINAAREGDIVVVAEGTYYENINFSGKAITVQSTDPGNPEVVATTVIDGDKNGIVVIFRSGEGPDSVLSGFTIRNGWTEIQGGGIRCEYSSPTITNNVIIDNEAEWGGGIACKWDADATLINNVIIGNRAWEKGGGIYCKYSSPTIINTIIADNLAQEEGGGIFCRLYSFPEIISCTIVHNTASDGGGIGCMAPGNEEEAIEITNSIVWWNLGNEGQQIHRMDNYPLVVRYSNIEGGWAGEHNIDADPLLTNLQERDYHLMYGSPCIDAGTSAGVPPYDIEGRTRPVGDGFDIGAYEWDVTDTDGDQLDDPWEIHYFGDLSHGREEDFDGDLITNGEEYDIGSDPTDAIHPQVCYVNAATGLDSRTYLEATNENTPWATIGRSLSDRIVGYGDTVVVSEGTYDENINFNGKAITLTSANPGDPEVVAATVIDGGGEATGKSVVKFNWREGSSSVLSGFTIRNGWTAFDAGRGGGIYCHSSSPTMRNDVVTGNQANGGGGIFCMASSPTVIDCTLSNNLAVIWGGGIYAYHQSSPTLIGTAIVDSSARVGGGIDVISSSITLINCAIERNSAFLSGGGASVGPFSSCRLDNNIIRGNDSAHGGGLYLVWESFATLTNNIVTDNSATNGGGVSCAKYSSADLINNTIARNSATDEGGGIECILESSTTITNSILWANEARRGAQIYKDSGSSLKVTYSDIQGGRRGRRNIDADPLFVKGRDGEYYLSQIAAGQPEDSPCVDAGDPDSELIDGTTRTDRVPDSEPVDMGYHYPAKQKNLVRNGGFEHGENKWKLNSVVASIDDTVSYKGKKSLRLDFTGGTQSGKKHAWQKNIEVVPGSSYELAGFVMTDNLQGGAVQIQAVDQENGSRTLDIRTEEISGTVDWTEISAEFTVPEETRLLKLIIRSTATDMVGRAWFDKISLRKNPL